MSEPALALSLAALGGGTGNFARDARFVRALPEEPAPVFEPVPETESRDPVADAWTEGYAQGSADAQEAAAQIIAEQDEARTRIELALGRLDAGMQADLKERLCETIMALCEAAIAPAALDPDGLARRVEVAAAMLARAQDERVIRLHPEDLALIAARLPGDWHFEPDAALERGAVRVEGAQGGVENGPEQWRQAIAEALRQC